MENKVNRQEYLSQLQEKLIENHSKFCSLTRNIYTKDQQLIVNSIKDLNDITLLVLELLIKDSWSKVD